MHDPQSQTEHDACGVGFIYNPVESHKVISDSVQALCNLEHRGALGADEQSGDGAGILTSIPWRILQEEGWPISLIRSVGVFFLPADKQEECRQFASEFLSQQGLSVVGWRKVPVNRAVLGPDANKSCPQIEFVLLSNPEEVSQDELEAKLVLARKHLINHIWSMPDLSGFYIASLSTSSIVYKAMVKSEALAPFYLDLQNPLFESKWGIFHRRFSTNTNPNWRLAQPFRMIAHNGEINTLSGNRNWLHAREMVMDHPLFADRKNALKPLVHPLGSDSANLDNLFELFVLAGLSPQEAMMRLIPEAHSEACHLHDADLLAFYEYHAALQEPWDGPAMIAFSDGKYVGASLDRNGLRPARYTIMKDGSVILCSEAGVLDLPTSQIAEKGRLGPGELISVEIANGQLHRNNEIKQIVSKLHPYAEWLEQERVKLRGKFDYDAPRLSASDLLAKQVAAAFGEEDVEQIIAVMAETAHEPIYSMGDDTALPVLSKQPRSIFDYFRQRFAQVTNPPIDHLREAMVFSLNCYLGKRSTALRPNREAARVITLESPFLRESQLAEIESLNNFGDMTNDSTGRATHGVAPTVTISMLMRKDAIDIKQALEQICTTAANAVRDGKQIIVLSDRKSSADSVIVPAILAVGAVHNYLIEQSLRMSASIVVETAQAWSTHQLACLLAFGAEAVCPYLAFETIRHRVENSKTNESGHFHPDQLDIQLNNYLDAANAGLLKILSKMGVSALTSYVGAQIFECIGIHGDVIKACFPGTNSHLAALTFTDIEKEYLRFHTSAYETPAPLQDRGMLRYRANGEYHGNNPTLVSTLHKALGYRKLDEGEEKLNAFLSYANLSRKHAPGAVRDLITFVSDREPIMLDEVEPVSSIVRKFCTGGMSLGALSPESHTSLAVAMNRMGAKSNSGEGGEDPARYRDNMKVNPDGTSAAFPGIKGLKAGDSAASAIRQVASARFGVTTEYLATAKQLEIKMAQGAKPGEGGQLPGQKVSHYIAKLRCADEGTTLISPPTHHDIYSIEDLAQLIYDLKQVNPHALISVKLVAEAGIGTIAAGVAKAKADIVQISGHDGGTGASPLSSIKHAGIPWELGLAEAQRVLQSTRLRERVILRVDGGLRSAWDIIIASMLGAEEFGFASIALVAQGCIMARVCHTNNCPVGITSQKESLRLKFPGLPEKVVEFFMFLAEDVRYMLAGLGYKTLDELTGRADLLRERPNLDLEKSSSIDLSALLSLKPLDHRNWKQRSSTQQRSEQSKDDTILADPEITSAIQQHNRIEKWYSINNRDRSVGARLSGRIAKTHGSRGYRGQINLNFEGAAGQSFGAFLVNNVQLILTGESNDYVGKGMSGGEIVVRPYEGYAWHYSKNTIVGNACLYGATGGKLYAAGQSGERFAVRNSRAIAVVEGTGDHCCEYMTGGCVVVLGPAGRNFGAGMTGGSAYVLDEHYSFAERCNIDAGMKLQRVAEAHSQELYDLIQTHHQLTNSKRAKEILERWADYKPLFWQITRQDEASTSSAQVYSVSTLDASPESLAIDKPRQ